MNLSDFVNQQQGIPEAPTTGLTYGRNGQLGSWVVVNSKDEADAAYIAIGTVLPYVGLNGDETVHGEKRFNNAMGLGFAPSPFYAINSAGSINVGPGSNYFVNGVPISSFIDAPSDGQIYGRQNSSWVIINAGGGGTVSNLSSTYGSNYVTILNSGGTDVTINGVTPSIAGVMSGPDKTKLDSLTTGSTKSDLATTGNTTTVTITNTGGNNATIPAATFSAAGVMTANDKNLLAAASQGTNLGTQYDATSVQITSNTGNNTSILASTSSLAGIMTANDKARNNASNEDRLTSNPSYSLNDVQLNRVGNLNPPIVLFKAVANSRAGVISGPDQAKLDGLSLFVAQLMPLLQTAGIITPQQQIDLIALIEE
jgi:hypothetical protein